MNEAAFMAEILAHPEEDAPRLLLADWWDENGQPERGEFVRVQVALARLVALDSPSPRESVPMSEVRQAGALLRRERELLDGVCGLGVEALPIIDGLSRTNFAGRGGYGWHQRTDASPDSSIEAKFRRGFVESVECTAAAWLTHADALTAAAPIREVRLTTWPEVHFSMPPGWGACNWQLGLRPRWWTAPQLNVHAGETDVILLRMRLFAAEWPRIAFTLPPAVAFPGNLEETTAMIRDEIIRSLGIPRDMIR